MSQAYKDPSIRQLHDNKLIYGGGVCSLNGNLEIKIITIHYEGKAVFSLDKNLKNNFILLSKKGKLIISPINVNRYYLKDLFTYMGYFKIKSSIAIDKNGNKVHYRIMHPSNYSENLNSHSETITVNSEDLKETYRSDNIISSPEFYINNLTTSSFNHDLHLKNGVKYTGDCHINLKTRTIMSESRTSRTSQQLYKSYIFRTEEQIRIDKLNFAYRKRLRRLIKGMRNVFSTQRMTYPNQSEIYTGGRDKVVSYKDDN